MSATGISAPATVAAMRSAAAAWLRSLSRLSRPIATIDLEDREERARWYYTPNPRRGLALNRMRSRQQQLALRLLASGLSEAGFTAANHTMALENALDRHEGWQQRRSHFGGRDPLRYTVAVFGDPTAERWGWRFEGHHLSVRYTVRGDLVSCTPLFLGGHPVRPSLPDGSMLDAPRLPASLAVALLERLSPDERAAATIAAAPPIDIVTANRSVVAAGSEPLTAAEMIDGVQTPEWLHWRDTLRAELGSTVEGDRALSLPADPDGVALGALAPEPRDRFQRLIDYYPALVPDDVAAGVRTTIAAADSPRFAWAGRVDVDAPTYFRIRNARFLVEFNNTQDQANHVHMVWRDPMGDFGRELFGEPSVEVPPRKGPLTPRIVGRLSRLLR